MTQNLLGFNDLPVGSQVTLQLNDRGAQAYGQVVPSTSSSLLLTDRNVRYVDEGGSDATGDGSRTSPFRTVQPAINACVAAGASLVDAFVVRVSPGANYGTFTLRPHVYVVGSGNSPGSYNGTPLSGATILAPNAAQALGTGWTGGGLIKASGIFNASLANAFVADFNAIGSAAANQIILENVTTESAITFTGSGNLEYATLTNVYSQGIGAISLANMGGAAISGLLADFGASLNLSQGAAIQSFFFITGSFVGNLNVTWTSAAIGNFLLASITGRVSQNDPSIVGKGAIVIADQSINLAMSDADNRLAFGNDNAATLVGLNHGLNVIQCTPTADRTLTIARPNSNFGATQILVVNQSGNGAVINLSFVAGATLQNGAPTYVPPGSSVLIIYEARAVGQTFWFVLPYAQSGTAQLTNGVSAFIPCDLQSTSTIVATLRTFNTATSFISAKPADRVNGTRAGGGGFKLTSVTGAGATVATDQSTYDWHVVSLAAGT